MSAAVSGDLVPRKGRGTELVLLILAMFIVIAAYVAVDLGALGRTPANAILYLTGLAILAGGAHVVLRLRAPHADPVLLPMVVLLNGLGLALIHRLDVAAAERARQTGEALPPADAPRQVYWMILGVLLFAAVIWWLHDHRVLQRFTYTAALAGILLLMLPLLPVIGVTINGARIWIRIAGMSFQPGEVAKIVLIIAFASYLVRTRDQLALAGRRIAGVDLPRARDLGPILVVWLVSLAILALERDLGPSVLLFGIFVAMLYIATERISWIFLGAALMLVGGLATYQFFSHVQVRVGGWLHPFTDPTGDYYQIVQSLYGLAYGGLLGTGLGRGHPEMVPYAKNDFILSAAGEELGLTGLMAIILIFGLIAARGLRIALVLRDPFGKLLAAGLAVSFALQVFIVVGGVTKLIPLSGLTTPFMSQGGSSLVMNWVLVALLLRISDAARRPAPPTPPPLEEAVTQVVRLQ